MKVIKVEDEEDEQGDVLSPLPSLSSPSGSRGATRRVSWGSPPQAGLPRVVSGIPRPILVAPAATEEPVASCTRRAMSEPPESLVATVKRKKLAVATAKVQAKCCLLYTSDAADE